MSRARASLEAILAAGALGASAPFKGDAIEDLMLEVEALQSGAAAEVRRLA